MKALVLGATGGCGAPCLLRLLERGVEVTVIVRSADRLPAAAKGHAKLKVVVAPEGHLALGVDEFAGHLRGADAVVSSLGHNLTFKGMYFPPRMLCVDSVRLICDAARQLAPPQPLRLVVVSTEGVDRPDGADPKRGLLERLLLFLLWLLLPPVGDNEAVLPYLHTEASANPHVDFVAVRPSDMVDGDERPYSVFATLQNGIFNAGQSTRANVGVFMADLVTKTDVWTKWRNGYPQLLDDTKKAA